MFNQQKKAKCNGLGLCCGNNDPPLVLNTNFGRKCQGINDTNCMCGGTARPEPCPGGYYCPTPDVSYPCDRGDYCRPGSTEPDPCPVRFSTFPYPARQFRHGMQMLKNHHWRFIIVFIVYQCINICIA